jgi:TRAP-type mannitol/chloroaromatic compound transport system permease small subunit
MLDTIRKGLKFIDWLSEASGKLFSWLIIPVILLEAAEVVQRYVFQAPTDWSWELAAMTAGALFMMGGAWVLKENNHVRTDVFYNKLSRKAKAGVNLFFFTIIFFSFAGVLIWKSIQEMLFSWRILEATFSMWAPPLYPLKTVIAVSFVLLGLQGLALWIRELIYLTKGVEL